MDNDGAFGVMPGGSGASWHHVLMLRVAWIRDNDQFYIRMFFCAMKLYDQPDGLDDQEEEECHCEQIPALQAGNVVLKKTETSKLQVT